MPGPALLKALAPLPPLVALGFVLRRFFKPTRDALGRAARPLLRRGGLPRPPVPW